MGKSVVKKTWGEILLDYFCPPFCLGCGCRGNRLCKCCEKNLKTQISPPRFQLYSSIDGILENCDNNKNCCKKHNTDSTFQLPVAVLESPAGLLFRLICQAKYQSDRAALRALAEIIPTLIFPLCTAGYVLVPLPTSRPHLRQRGFGLVETLAIASGLPTINLLKRAHQQTQVGQNAQRRVFQASSAYQLNTAVGPPNGPLLLFDDVMTTGASLAAAATLLRSSGYINLHACCIVHNR